MTMNKTPRWMKSVLAEAAKCDVQMPWVRGARRGETITRRAANAAAPALPARAIRA